MLSLEEIRHADAAFALYDQEWRYYSGFYGEPFLLNDCLAYFDGSVLSMSAFPLRQRDAPAGGPAILKSIERFFQYPGLRCFRIWGNYETLPPIIEHNGKVLKRVLQNDADPEDREAIIDVASFDLETNKPARNQYNQTRKLGFVTAVNKVDRLGAEHLALVEMFFDTHKMHPQHASYYLTLPSLIRNENVWLIEARFDGKLMGFGVMSRPNETSACLLTAFSDHAKPAMDAVYGRMLEYAKEESIAKINLGYSVSDSLLRFKRKWGATEYGPTWHESAYAADADMEEMLKQGTFLWRERLYMRSLETGHG